jgi:vitamin B12 transporter
LPFDFRTATGYGSALSSISLKTDKRIRKIKVVSEESMFRLFAAIITIWLAGILPVKAEQAEKQSYELDPIVVTGSHAPARLSEAGVSVSVITREDIAVMPADNISAVLENVNGVDVRQRGAGGVQTDIGIRGASYEQTLIMIDGVNMSDPQTGHHNMNLPVMLSDIERIEVIKGPAARIYGPNAMGGVINIITRDPKESAIGGRAAYGSHGYYDLGAHATLRQGDTSSRLSAGRRSASDYLSGKDTDFDIKTINYKGVFHRDVQTFRLGAGFTDKDFGAYKFYSDVFPEQREKTETLLCYGDADLYSADAEISPLLYWRRHQDEFKININGDWNVNDHQTDVLGSRIKILIRSGWGETAVGADAEREDIKSSSLGDHDRSRQSLFLEHRLKPLDRLNIGLGASAVHYSSWGWELWPGADMRVELIDGLSWFTSFENSFRVPTYTELYYSTPANQGNPDLKPEEAWTAETGLRWLNEAVTADLSLFYRDADDVIDWSRQAGGIVWQAANISSVKTKGGSAGVTIYPPAFSTMKFFSSAGIAYTYLDSDRRTHGLESKYVLDYLKHQVNGSVVFTWLPALTQAIKARYGERMAGDNYTVVDTRLTWSFSDYDIFIEAANLFDKDYIESGFTPMPGRWIKAGVRFTWDLPFSR